MNYDRFTEINGLLIPKNLIKSNEDNKNDKWDNGNGNDYITSKVLYFTDKNFSGVLKINRIL